MDVEVTAIVAGGERVEDVVGGVVSVGFQRGLPGVAASAIIVETPSGASRSLMTPASYLLACVPIVTPLALL